MSKELQLGKYEFYPYEFDKSRMATLEDLIELLKKAKARSEKDIKTPFRSLRQRQPHRKRRGYAPRKCGFTRLTEAY